MVLPGDLGDLQGGHSRQAVEYRWGNRFDLGDALEGGDCIFSNVHSFMLSISVYLLTEFQEPATRPHAPLLV